MPDVTPLRTGDPEQVAGHRLAGRIGAGGQGVVYLGMSALGEPVAIKLLRVEDERSREQFAKEVAAARRVAPFCTAQILDFDLEAQPPYVISEFIEGLSLQQYVETRGPLTGTRLQRLAIGTATALAAIHQAGVVHRDMKPANVMLSPEGPRVIDFGIARDLSNDTTKVSKLFGTPAYMSPEQLRGERVGPSTDLFAWGSVMTFAATGRAPFEAPHMMAAINKIAHEEPDLTGVPPELLTVLRQCFSKDPAYRPTAQHALSMLLGRPEETNPPNSAVVLAEATQLVESSTTGPTESYATGEAPVDPDVHPTEVHRPATVAQTRVDRPQATSVEEGPTVRNPNPNQARLRPPRPTGTTGPVSPGIPSGDIPPWGTPAASNASRPRPTPASRPQRPNQNPAQAPAAFQQPGQYAPPGGQPPAGSPQVGQPQSSSGQSGQGQSGQGQMGPASSAQGQAGGGQARQGQPGQRPVGPPSSAQGNVGPGQVGQPQSGSQSVGQGQVGPGQAVERQAGRGQAAQGQPDLGDVGPGGVGQPQSGSQNVGQGQVGPVQAAQRQASRGQTGQAQVGHGSVGPGRLGQSSPRNVGQGDQGQVARPQAGQGQSNPQQAAPGQASWQQAGQSRAPQPGLGKGPSGPVQGPVQPGASQSGSGQPSADQSQPEIPIWGQPSTRSRPPRSSATPQSSNPQSQNAQPGTAVPQGRSGRAQSPQGQNPVLPNPQGQNPSVQNAGMPSPPLPSPPLPSPPGQNLPGQNPIQAPQNRQQLWGPPPNVQPNSVQPNSGHLNNGHPNSGQPNSGQPNLQPGWGQPPTPKAPALSQRMGNSGPVAPPNATGWNQPWGSGNGNAPTQIPTSAQKSRRRPLILGCVAVVLAIVVGAGVWKAVSNVSSSGGGYSNPSSGENKEKGAKEGTSGSCSKLLNAGADGSCPSGSSKGSTDNSSSSKSGSSEDDSQSADKVAAAGTLPYSLAGVWEGDISQPKGAVQDWQVRLDLKGGKKKPGTMRIEELGCSSNVTVENAGYTTAKLRVPVLNKNNPGGVCAGLGEVILVQDPSDPDTLSFTWRDLTNPGNAAIGEVERADD